MSIQDVIDNKLPYFIPQGHSMELLKQIPDETVQCVVTSPPYWGLRDYKIPPTIWGGNPLCTHVFVELEFSKEIRSGKGLAKSKASTRGGAKKVAKIPDIREEQGLCQICGAWKGTLGLEPTRDLYIDHLILLFQEIKRVLRKDGTCFVNIGDSSAGSSVGWSKKPHKVSQPHISSYPSGRPPNYISSTQDDGLKPKELSLIPFLLAIALQRDGWWIRRDNIWAKGVSLAKTYHGSCMPSSVEDAPTQSHEYVFLITKSKKYYYDRFAVREEAQTETFERAKRGVSANHKNLQVPGQKPHSMHKARANGEGYGAPEMGRNLRSVWCINPERTEEEFYASYPTKLALICVKLGTSEKGCCPHCKTPWKRIVEPTPEYAQHLGKDWGNHEQDHLEGRGHFKLLDGSKSNQRAIKRIGPSITAEYITKGWKQACKCEPHEPIPSIVFDPFNGRGTTGVAAHRMKQRYIGLELNEKAIEMSKRRIEEDSPLFDAVNI